MRPGHRWTRDDWIVLGVLMVALAAFVLLAWDDAPTSWRDRPAR